MENKEPKKKMTITPEQVEKACEKMGETANAVDNLYGNVKDKLGPIGKSIGFGILVTFVFALINNPYLVFILALGVAVGCAPMIRKKVIEIKAAAEAQKNSKKEEKKEEPKE